MNKDTFASVAHLEGQQVAPSSRRNWKKTITIACVASVAAVALTTGFGSASASRLTKRSDAELTSTPNIARAATCPYKNLATIGNNRTTPTSSNKWWQPAVGTTWQIVLNPDSDVPKLTYDYAAYDLDLFDVPQSTITTLHSKGKKVMCYFSAGSAEDWRADYPCFTKSDQGAGLSGWNGENWLVTNSTNVRNIMLARLDYAAQKGCDGVDPDNVDGYDNKENHLGLTKQDAISYVSFLADAAHARNMSIGLKNAADIGPNVLSKMQWEVNEECIARKECGAYQVFIKAGKPVFNIEYPPEDHIEDDWKLSEEQARCKQYATPATGATNFTTVLKKYSLDEWIQKCPIS